MEFKSYSSSDASSSSKGKKTMKQYRHWGGEEQDRLGMLSQRDLEDSPSSGVVDCSLRLGPPGSAAAATPGGPVLPSSRFVIRPLVPPPTSPHHALAAPTQSTGIFQTEVCTMCAATETPLWRRGPHGPKSLCNACGIRYKKEERRLSLSLGIPNYQMKAHREHQKPNNGFKG